MSIRNASSDPAHDWSGPNQTTKPKDGPFFISNSFDHLRNEKTITLFKYNEHFCLAKIKFNAHINLPKTVQILKIKSTT